jgi:tetratricopeptide (TPR) repeat protein
VVRIGTSRKSSQKEVRFELAQCLVKLRQVERALEVVRNCDQTPDVLTLLADCEYALGNEEEARELLAQARQFELVPLETFDLQGTMALEAKEVSRALEIFEEGVRHYPEDFGLRFRAELHRRVRILGWAATSIMGRAAREARRRDRNDSQGTASRPCALVCNPRGSGTSCCGVHHRVLSPTALATLGTTNH